MIHRRLDTVAARSGLVAVVLPTAEVAELPRLTGAQLADAAHGGAPAVLRRQLLAALAGRVLGIGPGEVRLATDAVGRRVLEGRGVYASIAWRPGWVAAALADRPVGIDIELTAEAEAGRVIALAGFGGDAAELAAWHGPAGVWAAKEAALKANGRDLTSAPGDWTFEESTVRATGLTSARLVALSVANAVVALASAGRD